MKIWTYHCFYNSNKVRPVMPWPHCLTLLIPSPVSYLGLICRSLYSDAFPWLKLEHFSYTTNHIWQCQETCTPLLRSINQRPWLFYFSGRTVMGITNVSAVGVIDTDHRFILLLDFRLSLILAPFRSSRAIQEVNLIVSTVDASGYDFQWQPFVH